MSNSLKMVENVGNKNGLGSTWMLQCQNESCPSHERNLAFSTTEKSRVFEINRASVLGFRSIGGGHAAASKLFNYFWSLCHKQEILLATCGINSSYGNAAPCAESEF